MAKKKKMTPRSIAEMIAVNLQNEDADLSITERILKHGIKTSDGRPFEFKDRPYLIDIYDDMNPKQVLRSASQLGKSEGLYVKALFLAEDGLNIIITQPTQSMSDTMTKTKLNRIIAANPHFQQMTSGDLSLKFVKNNLIFLLYTQSEVPSIGISADCYFSDECARSNKENVEQMYSRLTASKFKWEYMISNPVGPSSILEDRWNISDQKHWVIKCPHCNKSQILVYFPLDYGGELANKSNVCKERKAFVCQHCDRIWEDPYIRVNGQWVNRYQMSDERPFSGYWLSQLCRREITVSEMMVKEKENKMKFYNMFLGLPYAGSDISLTAPLFHQNIVSREEVSGRIVGGMDVGAGASGGHRIVIMQGNTVIALENAASFDEAEEILTRFGAESWVTDYMPDFELAKKFQSHFPNIVMRCRLEGNHSRKDEIVKTEEDKGLIHCNKHLYFDNMVNQLAEGEYKFALSKNSRIFDEFIQHFSVISKIPDLDSSGNPIFKWDTQNGKADHFSMAFLFATLAKQRLDDFSSVHHPYQAENTKPYVPEQNREPELEFILNQQKDWYNS